MTEKENQLIEPEKQSFTTRIAGDVVNQATENLPERQRDAIRRLHAHYFANNLSLGECAQCIGKSDSAVGLLFRGKYPAKLNEIVEAIELFFSRLEQGIDGDKLPFIKTSLSEHIWDVCHAARAFHQMAFLIGNQQIGKSKACRGLRQDKKYFGNTYYFAMPTGGTLTNTLLAAGREMHLPDTLSISRLRERIKACVNSDTQLIVDEAQRCVDQGVSSRSIQSIEFFREVFDDTGCSVVFAGGHKLKEAMESGPLEPILRHTRRRLMLTVVLPEKTPQADLNLFAAHYGLAPSAGPARDLETKIVTNEALGRWLTLLRMGANIAIERNQKMTWAHVLAAHAGMKALEGKKF